MSPLQELPADEVMQEVEVWREISEDNTCWENSVASFTLRQRHMGLHHLPKPGREDFHTKTGEWTCVCLCSWVRGGHTERKHELAGEGQTNCLVTSQETAAGLQTEFLGAKHVRVCAIDQDGPCELAWGYLRWCQRGWLEDRGDLSWERPDSVYHKMLKEECKVSAQNRD